MRNKDLCTTSLLHLISTERLSIMAAESTQPKEQIVDPWTAQAGEGEKKINYDKLIGKLIWPNIAGTTTGVGYSCMS